MKHPRWIRWHALAAVFFAPLVLVYALTGLLHLTGFEPTSASSSYAVSIAGDAPTTAAEAARLLAAEAAGRGLDAPRGDVVATPFGFRWGHLTRHHIDLRRHADGTWRLQTEKPGVAARLGFLHRGDGGRLVRALGIGVGLYLALVHLAALVWARRNLPVGPLVTAGLGGIIVALLAMTVAI